MIINKQYFQDKDLEVKEKKQKLPVQEALIQGRKNIIKRSSSDSEEDTNGHEYVEIGGLKWATMNVGANSVTDSGLYFQWGDTQGYTASQVGSGEGQKYFGWADYKYGNGTSSPGATGMTKYNATDGKVVLDASDDAAIAIWGGKWRIPTYEEFISLLNSTTNSWTTIDNIYGRLFTDLTDGSKTLFFPAYGYANNGSVASNTQYSFGYFMSSSAYNDDKKQRYNMNFSQYLAPACVSGDRYMGLNIRPVAD